MLLQWCTLEPSGPSNLAAIRFSSPIRVNSIHVFPTDSQPFAQCPEIIARTEPNSFFLDVFFNAQAIHPESRDKQRAPNALVPTVIAYAGGKMDFTVDMGPEYSTRLIIIKGNFQSVSLAIYGEVVSEKTLPSPTYEPRFISSNDTTPLSRLTDPSNARDPTLLASQLLALIPDSPPLPLVIRLMLCLKPADDDWDSPDFPFLFHDLAEDTDESFDLGKAFQYTSKPVADDAPRDLMQKFAQRVASSIGPNSCDQSSLVAGVLCQVSPQHPDMSLFLVGALDLESIFDAQHMDESTLSRLLDAVSNFDIARHLNTEWFLGVLHHFQELPSSSSSNQSLVRRLIARIQGWQVLEDALSNTQADFDAAIEMIKDIGKEENSFGIWLQSMITHPNLLTKLAENPVLPTTQCPPPFLNVSSAASHDNFIAFVRAYIGVSSVLAVYAWSDSLPNVRCRERILGILRLWQSVDGYREIVNHLLLLRQMVFRLECLTEYPDPPSPSTVYVEHILVDLLNDPHALLRRHLVRCVLSLRQPLSYITEEERLTMRKLALLADDGVSSAVEELSITTPLPLNMKNLRILRLSLAIIERELENDFGEQRVLEVLWEEGSHGLISHLIDIFVAVSEKLKANFLPTPPLPMPQILVEQLFRTAADLLKLIVQLTPAFPQLSRSTSALTASVADIFTYTDAADMVYSQSSPACIAAQVARQTCIYFVRHFSGSHNVVDQVRPQPEIVLRTLLRHGMLNDGRDPAYHLLQVFCLVDHFLPSPTENDESQWFTSVIPNVLPDLLSFFRVLDTHNKLHFVKRLVNLDGGVIGIGEWLFTEELKHLHRVLQSLDNDADDSLRSMRQYDASLSLYFIAELFKSLTEWSVGVIENDAVVAQTLTDCLMCLVEGNLSASYIPQITEILSQNCAAFDPALRSALVLTLFRIIQNADILIPISLSTSLHILRGLPENSITADRMGLEIGRIFSTLSRSGFDLEGMNLDTANTLLSIVEWFSEHHSTTHIHGITAATFEKLTGHIKQVLPPTQQTELQTIRTRITFDEEDYFIPGVVDLVERIALSIQDVQGLLHPPTPAPSTPKRTTPEVLGLVPVSSPTALLRSPAATGLTKTYSNNDFRQLRQLPSARQNTSRLPSMHVDDFEASPVLVSAPMPEVFPNLSPKFNMQ